MEKLCMAENVMFNDKMFENSKYCKPFLQRFSLEFPHHGISSQHLMYVVILICTKNFGQNKISLRFKVDFHCGELRNIRIFLCQRGMLNKILQHFFLGFLLPFFQNRGRVCKEKGLGYRLAAMSIRFQTCQSKTSSNLIG